MKWGRSHLLVPVWLRRNRSRGGVTLIEAAVSFMILGITALGALKTFALGRVGLEGDYEMKMAAELLRQKTEWIIGVCHQQGKMDWPGTFELGDLRGEQVTVDRRAGVGRSVEGIIYYGRIKEVDDPETTNTNPDYYEINSWIIWRHPQTSVWQDVVSERPLGRLDTVRYIARVVPTWIDNK